MSGLIIISVIIVRYLPQAVIDFRNKDRRIRELHKTSAKGIYVMALYSLIALIILFQPPENNLITDKVSILGISLYLLGALLGDIGLWNLRHYYSEPILIYEDHKLILNGIYSLVRHPIRLGLALELLGLVIYSGNFYLFAPLGIVILIQIVRSHKEDMILSSHFGELAVNYQKKVPAFNLLKGMWRVLFESKNSKVYSRRN